MIILYPIDLKIIFGISLLQPGPPQVCIPGYAPVGARGTIRYIAPEVFCRNFGGVSHKSDVYSYETMVLEMVVVKNIDVSGDCTSEVYFSTLDLQAP